MGLLDDKLSYMQLQNTGETVDADNLYEQNAKYYERAKNANVIPCFAGDDLQAKVDAASTGGVIDPYGVLDYRPRVPGLLTEYDSAPGAHVKPAYTKDNIVILQKGGTYDTLKKARDAAGDDGVIYCIPDAVVSPGEGTPLATAVAAANAGDILYLEDGVYDEALVTLAANITLVGGGVDVCSIPTGLVLGSAGTEVIGIAGIAVGAMEATNENTWDCLELYLVDAYIADYENGLNSTWVGDQVLEAWNTEFEADICGAISNYSGQACTITLHNCYVHTDGNENAANASAMKNVGSGGTIKAYDCKFSRKVVEAAATDADPVVFDLTGNSTLLFERCHFVSDVTGCVALETEAIVADTLTGLASTMTLLDCYFQTNAGASVTVTHIDKNAASTVRYARCAANDELAVATGVTEMKALQH